MTIEVLILHYIQEKRRKPHHANELLDYIQNEYVNGKLSILQYRSLCQDLYLRGANPTTSG
ncbi:YppF family protein [Peribacillus muralis]|uniref:YppF family protein n=1 Tax=Peribacillus muralis TaxID=264697 RepID=UPI0009E7034E|nr:YppF family protein [Peribacillus muralis]MCK1993610.1 YppF family protein [Peribacillus muralis]MCK2014102.1 YppF family protein [Peribacillus muralis]